MLIHEHELTRDNGERYLLILFSVHKSEIYRAEITLEHDRCKALRIAKDKERVINEFLNSFNGKKFTEKEVLKAYSKVDEYFKGVYKEKFPQGGYRNGGRPKGSKTNKTARLNLAVTPEEKTMLNNVLTTFRMHSEQNIEEMRKALKPYLDKIDESLNGDKIAQEKFRARVNNMNPMLYPQLLEYFKIFGVEDAIPVGIKNSRKTEKPTKVKKVSDEYIQAIEEIQKEKTHRKLRTLDEAYKEYQEYHGRGKNGNI